MWAPSNRATMMSRRYSSFNGNPFIMKPISVMVSACLLGVRCRYDGGHSLCPGLVSALDSAHIVPFCPEQLGGLPTPRPAADIWDGDGLDVLTGRGRVIDATGMDVSGAFRKGAEEALRLARLTETVLAVVKDRSPSCGVLSAHCQNAEGRGPGVTAALFQREGIRLLEQGPDSVVPRDCFFDCSRSINTEEKTDVWTRTR